MDGVDKSYFLVYLGVNVDEGKDSEVGVDNVRPFLVQCFADRENLGRVGTGPQPERPNTYAWIQET